MATEIRADVVVSDALPADVEAQLKAFFTEVGAETTVRLMPPRRGWAEAQWLVLATIPLQAFMTAFVAKAADDAYQRVKTLTHRLSALRSPPASDYHPLVLQDSAHRLKVVLEPDLPQEAYRELAALDLSRFKHGPLHYDRSLSRWRSEIDESDPRRSRPKA